MRIRKIRKCPVCKTTKAISGWQGQLTNVTSHIKAVAKSELLDRELGLKKKTPHLDYYKKHVVIVKKTKLMLIYKI